MLLHGDAPYVSCLKNTPLTIVCSSETHVEPLVFLDFEIFSHRNPSYLLLSQLFCRVSTICSHFRPVTDGDAQSVAAQRHAGQGHLDLLMARFCGAFIRLILAVFVCVCVCVIYIYICVYYIHICVLYTDIYVLYIIYCEREGEVYCGMNMGWRYSNKRKRNILFWCPSEDPHGLETLQAHLETHRSLGRSMHHQLVNGLAWIKQQ